MNNRQPINACSGTLCSHFFVGLTLGSLGFLFTKKQNFRPLLRGMCVRYALFVVAIIAYFVISRATKLSDGLSQEKARQEQAQRNQTLREEINRAREEQEANLAAIRTQQAVEAAQEAEKARIEGCLKILVAGEGDIVAFKERINDILNGKTHDGFDAKTIFAIATNADVQLEQPYKRIAQDYNTNSSLITVEWASENVQHEVNRLNARLSCLDEYRKLHETMLHEKAERMEAETRLQFASNLISGIDFSAINHKIVIHRYLAKYLRKRTNDYDFLKKLYDLQQQRNWLGWVNAASLKNPLGGRCYAQLPDTNTISSIVESVKRSPVTVQFSFQKIPHSSSLSAVRLDSDGQTLDVSGSGYGNLRVKTSLDSSITYVIESGAINYLNNQIRIAKRQGVSADACLRAALSVDTPYDGETLRKIREAKEAKRKHAEVEEKVRKQRAKQKTKQKAKQEATRREKYRLK